MKREFDSALNRLIVPVLLLVWVLNCAGCSTQKVSLPPNLVHSDKPISQLVPAKPNGLKVIIFGIDGGEWDIILPMVQAGRLPHIKKLLKEGAHGELQSLEPTLSPIIWTTIATGKLPEKHGIHGFTVSDPKTNEVIPVSSQSRKTNAFWNIYSNQNWTVGVVGWLATWPAEKVNGFLCSIYTYPPIFKFDRDPIHNQNIHSTYPESLHKEIGQFLISPEKLEDRTFQKERLNALTKDYAKRFVFSRDWAYRRIGLDLLDIYKPNVFAIYFDGTDMLSHFNFPMYKWYRWVKYDEPTQVYIEPNEPDNFKFVNEPIRVKTIPGYTPQFERFILDQGEALEHYYEFMDETLGEVLKRANDQTIIAVVSDHGFGLNLADRVIRTGDEAYSRPTHWHKLMGILLLKGPGVKKETIVKGVSVKDILPTVLYLSGYPVGEDMDGKIIWDAINDKYRKDHSPISISSYDSKTTLIGNTTTPMKSPYTKEILEQLKSLGYIQ